jgi:hypothetical protein
MPLTATKNRLLWVGRREMPPNLVAALDGPWEVALSDRLERQELDWAQVVVLAPSPPELDDIKPLLDLLDRLDRSAAVGLLLLPKWHLQEHPLAQRSGQTIVADAAASPSQLSGRLQAALALQGVIRDLKAEVAAVRGFGKGIARNLEEMDEEMRLAARLQRDFLPQTLPELPGLNFASLFRPASWVSGDIYDVFQLDEQHVGFYVADVVGHGMPAALLTMFIKKALPAKLIQGKSYKIIPPHKALETLNSELCQQQFSSCQFCTAFYGVINASTHLLRYARAGHPMPFFLAGDGTVKRLEGEGPLLGVFPNEKFQDCQVQLSAGQRVVVYSDGAEDRLSGIKQTTSALLEELLRLRHFRAQEMLFHLASQFDRPNDDARCEDDVTVVVVDATA